MLGKRTGRVLQARSKTAIALTLGVWACLGNPLQAQADTAFVGEVVCAGYNFCPVGFAECNGQILPISQYSALFSLLGTTYGGNGTSNFALPNLASSTMVGQGQGAGLTDRVMGEAGGTETVSLNATQIPSHTHSVLAHNNALNGAAQEQSASPSGRIAGTAPATALVYGASASLVPMHTSAMSLVGGSQPHNNLQPYLAMKCCIAISGVFPARN